MRQRPIVATFALVVLCVAAFAQGPRRDGNWEVQMVMDVPGMPAGMPPMTTTQCITPEMARDPQRAIPQGRGRGMTDQCKISDYKVEGNKVSWSMKCEGPEAMTGTGEMIYSGDTYTGTVTMDRGGQTVAMKYSGKRLGDCDQ
jgi:hypothetical protein